MTKTLNNFRIDNKFEEITISQVTICAPSTAVYKLTLPIDDGTSGQVLTTDGEGVTSWTSDEGGTVTSVAATVPAFLSISGSPITSSGTLAIGLSGTALLTANGGTGSTANSTGSGGVVLQSGPTFSGTTINQGLANYQDQVRVLQASDGDRLYIGNSIANRQSGILRWFGTTDSSTNHLDIGFFGIGNRFEFRADGNFDCSTITLDSPLAILEGGTGVSTATGTDNVVLSNSPSITSPILTTPIVKGTSFNTTLDTQATEDWTLSLPVDGGDSGQVMTTDGSGNTSWTFDAGGTVTSVATSVPPFLSISGSPITTSGTLAIGLSGTALQTSNGGTGSVTASTGTGGVVLHVSPTMDQPIIRGTGSGTTTLDTAAITAITLRLPEDEGTTNSLLLSDGLGTTRWVKLGNLLPLLGATLEVSGVTGELSISFGTLFTITSTAALATTNAGTLTTQGTAIGVNAGGILANAGNISDNFNAIQVRLTNVGLNVPSPFFLQVDNSPIDSQSISPDLELSFSGTALPILNGGTGETTATGTGPNVQSNDASLNRPIILELEVKGTVFNTVLKTAATLSNWTLTLPSDGGLNNQVLATDGNGVTNWASPGTVTSVQASVPAFMEVLSDPVTGSGTIAITLSETALPTANGGTGSVADSTGTGGVVLKTGPKLFRPKIDGVFGGLTTIDTLATSDWTFSLPVDGGTNNQVLTTNGAGLTTWQTRVTSVQASVPAFMEVLSSPVTTTGTIAITLSSTALPVANGGTGSVAASTGTGGVVLAGSPSLTAPTFTSPKINGLFGLTTLDTQATSAWTLSLPTGGGTNNQVLTTNGFGTTSWQTSTGGTVTSVAVTVPDFLSISGSPITSSGTLAIGLSGTALQPSNGGTGSTATSTGSGGVVLSSAPTINNLTGTGLTMLTEIDLTTPLATDDGGTGVTGTSTGSTGVVLKNSPTILNLTGTGITSLTTLGVTGLSTLGVVITAGITTGAALMSSAVITSPLGTSSGGTGVSAASTGTGGVVLSTSPTFETRITVNGIQDAFHEFKGNNQTIQINDDSSSESTQITTVRSANFFCQGSIAGDTVIRNASGNKNILMVAGNSAAGPQVYLDTGGNVGIRNLNPTSTLDVTGTLAVSSSMTANSLSLTAALPVTSGGTGVTTSTGSGANVLGTAPTLTSPSLTGNIVADQTIKVIKVANGDRVLMGFAEATDQAAIFRWTGTTSSNQNTLKLGFFGTGVDYEFRADGQATFPDLVLTNALAVTSGGTGVTTSTGSGANVLGTSPTISAPTLSGVTAHTGNIEMDDNEILLRTDANHGLAYDSGIDGPNLFGFTKGRLSTGVGGGDGRMWYDTNGISTNNSDFFKYTESSWTPTWGLSGSVTYHERSGHYVKCGQQTTVFFELRITVTGAPANTGVFFTGLNLTNPLSSFQRCNLTYAAVGLLLPPMNLTVQNGATDLLLFNVANQQVQTDNLGFFSGTFYSVFSYISA